MSSKRFLKSIHPWISLCVFFYLQTPFALETAKGCNGSKEGALMSAKLLRKIRRSFPCVSLTDYASCSSRLWRHLAADFHWKETQGFGVPLGNTRKVGPPDFWICTETESEWAPSHWCGKIEIWKGTHWFILMCWHVIPYFILLYFIMTRRNKVCLPYDWNQTNPAVLGWVRRFSASWEMTSKLSATPNKSDQWQAASPRTMRQQAASDTFHFALLLMAWKEAMNPLW